MTKRLEEDHQLTQKTLAQEIGVAGSFVGRILNLLKLAPDIQAEILKLPPTIWAGPINEFRLGRIARLDDHVEQRREFRKVAALKPRLKIPRLPEKAQTFQTLIIKGIRPSLS